MLPDPSKNTRNFYLLLSGFALLVFAANWTHSNQQQIYCTRYLPLAHAILNGELPYAVTKVFYPIWGYPFVMTLGVWLWHPNIVIEVLQFIAAVMSIVLAYRLIELTPRLWHIPFFLPYFALCSVKWPDAFVAILFLLHIVFAFAYLKGDHPPTPSFLKRGSWMLLFFAALTLALIVNFRTEYLFFPVVELLVAAIYFVRRKNKQLLIVAASSVLACVIGISPWYCYTASVASHPRLTTSNGAGVLYISLGQLPGNPWGIRHLDSDAYLKAQQMGIADPYSETGERALTQAFDSAVSSHPGLFGLKVARNFGMAFVGGLYTGEYANLLLNDAQRVQLEQAHSINGIPIGVVAVWVVEKALRILSIPLLLILLLLFVAKRKSLETKYATLHPLILALVIYRIATVALIQYEPRHVNLIYVPLLFYAFSVIQSRIEAGLQRPYDLKSFFR